MHAYTGSQANQPQPFAALALQFQLTHNSEQNILHQATGPVLWDQEMIQLDKDRLQLTPTSQIHPPTAVLAEWRGDVQCHRNQPHPDSEDQFL